MSLQGVAGFSPPLKAFVALVREYTRDHPELNRLVAGEESSDRLIALAAYDALADFNGTPPFLGNFSLEDLLSRSQHALLVRMTVVTLIESVGLLQTRNHINYSDGGMNVGVNDKTPHLMNWLQYFKATTEQKLQRVKVAMNIESILGPGNFGAHSEYWTVNGSW